MFKTKIPKLLLIILFWYLFVFVSSEVLSFFHLLVRAWVIPLNLIFWLSVAAFSQKISPKIKVRLPWIILVIFFLLFIQGFLSAPNTTDSLVYRLPRVMYWIQGQSSFQSEIFTSHDFMPALPDYLLLHLYLIFNSDRFLFLSQWLALIGSVYTGIIIFRELSLSHRNEKYVGILLATIPMAVLQASSTQVDLISSFLLLASVYFALVFSKKQLFKYFLLACLSVAMGFLTKATFLIFAIVPIGLLLNTLVSKRGSVFKYLIVGLGIFLIFSSRYFFQNMRFYGTPFGKFVDSSGTEIALTNEFITPQSIFINTVKNLFLHIPVPFFGHGIENAIHYTEGLLNLRIDDSKITFYHTEFKILPVVYPQEDLAGNPLNLFLFIVAGFVGLRTIKNKESPVRLIYLLSILTFIVFSSVLKWQPWHSRLHLPIFWVGTIVAAVVLSGRIWFLKIVSILSMILAFFLIIFNVSRPYISYSVVYQFAKKYIPLELSMPESFFLKPRMMQFFNSTSYWYIPYDLAINEIQSLGMNSNLGVYFMDDHEYPFWALLREKGSSVKVIKLNDIYERGVEVKFITSPKEVLQDGYASKCFETGIKREYACLLVK